MYPAKEPSTMWTVFTLEATRRKNLDRIEDPCNPLPNYNFTDCVIEYKAKNTNCTLPWHRKRRGNIEFISAYMLNTLVGWLRRVVGILGGRGEARLCFCEKWLNLATGVSSWGEAFSEYRDRPQIMAGCKFFISVLWIGGRGPSFLGWVKSANLNIFGKDDNRPTSSLSLS